MKKHSVCPVCSCTVLRRIGAWTAEIVEPPRSIQQGGTNAILKHVLAGHALTTETMLCGQCRHLFLSPTFDDAELDRLYSPTATAETKRQYRESERVTGRSWAEQHAIPAAEQEALRLAARHYRPRRLQERVAAVRPPGEIRKILDFGARTGELTECFPKECQRYVYDKDLSAMADLGVIPLGSFEAIRSNGPYDLIVLSHVLEHIPYPTHLLIELNASLTPDGVLDVEVPIEYCGTILKRRGIPIGPHVNYFCRSSLLACLRSASLHGIAIRREVAPYGECQVPVLKALARKSGPDLPGATPWPWRVDWMIDAALIFRARKWRKRFH